MKTRIFLILIISIIGCSHIKESTELYTYDERLIGTWISDKDKTIKWLRENRKYSDERLERVFKIYGKLKLTISKTKVISEYDGNVEEQPIEIIAIEGDTIAIKAVDGLSNCPEIRIIRIEDENTYSIYQDMFDIREYFRRIE